MKVRQLVRGILMSFFYPAPCIYSLSGVQNGLGVSAGSEGYMESCRRVEGGKGERRRKGEGGREMQKGGIGRVRHRRRRVGNKGGRGAGRKGEGGVGKKGRDVDVGTDIKGTEEEGIRGEW